MLNIQKIRSDFPILQRKINGKPLVYFDNSATSQKPRQVIEAMVDYYEKHNANVHRGVYTLADEATEMYEKAREKVALFIGAKPSELIFVRNTTEAINLVCWTWGYDYVGKGDLILTTEMEHHSNIVPWQQLCRSKGCKLEFVKVKIFSGSGGDPISLRLRSGFQNDNGEADEFLLDMEDLERRLEKKPKLVCITHVSNVLGTINSIKEIVKKAHKAGAKALVDGAQSVPHMKVDVKDLGCDFLAFSGHKMLGPMGIGGLFIKREIVGKMRPFLTGGGMISQVKKTGSTFDRAPVRFEAGTPNVAGAVGLAAAVDYLQKIGMEKVLQHEQELTEYFLTNFRFSIFNFQIKILGPRDVEKKAGVVSFVVKDVHAHDVAQILDKEGIAVRAGHHCAMPLHQKLKVPATVRVSFYVYNTKDEVDLLIEGLENVRKIFS